MSRTPATTPTPGPGLPAVAATAARRRRPSAVTLAIAVATAVALGLRLYQLSRPGFLLGVTEYDDGTDFGSAVRLAGGSLPYRDFIIVQPPGITLLMAPAALLGKGIGTAGALGVARVLTVLASAAGVVLAGLLVRHRGLLAVIIGCGVLAVFPDSVEAAKTVLLEPWLVLFCLAGALVAFEGDSLRPGSRRLAAAGLLFGCAGAIKVWAILPVAVLLVLAARRPRRAAGFAAGVAAGFAVPVLPFAALAPRAFYDSVIVAQLVRTDQIPIPLGIRAANMTGLSRDTHAPGALPIAIAAVLLILIITGSCLLASRLTRRPPPQLEWFALGTLAVIVIAFLWPADFYYHYPAFLAPFLGLAIALPVTRLLAARQAAATRERAGRWPRPAAPALAGVLLALLAAGQGLGISRIEAAVPGSQLAAVRQLIPQGACVLSDQVSYQLATNRFDSSVRGCSLMVDGVGTDYALSLGRNGLGGAGRSAAVRRTWMSAFRSAQYLWLTTESVLRIPWTPGLQKYFLSHFVPLMVGPQWVYVRRGLPPA